jgi:hypothetical protein
MDYYSQGNVPSAMGKNQTTGVTVDKVCKLLRAGQPLVWSVAIVLGVLGVSLTIHYFWKRKRVLEEERTVYRTAPKGNSWTET